MRDGVPFVFLQHGYQPTQFDATAVGAMALLAAGEDTQERVNE